VIGRWRQTGLFQSLMHRGQVVTTVVATALLLQSWLLPLVASDLGEVARLLQLAALLLAGIPIVAGAIAGLSQGRTNVDELVSLALLGCVGAGEFGAGAVVAVLMRLGNLAEEFTAARARRGIERLIRMQPDRARVRRGDEDVEIPAAELQAGDLVVVRPAETIPADGDVTWGRSWVDESAITGESLQREKEAGSTVFAGTCNANGALHVRVTRAGTDTTLSRIAALVVDAESSQAPIIRLADALAGFFTPVILAIAALVLWTSGDISRALAVLIVGCPCALILATPTAVVAALSCAARRGVLIKSGAMLEAAAKLDTFYFDKTGTVTTGRMELVELETFGPFDRRQVLELAAAAEKHSHHPLAEELVRTARAEDIQPSDPDHVDEQFGQGVDVRLGGRRVVVGRREYVGSHLNDSGDVPSSGEGGKGSRTPSKRVRDPFPPSDDGDRTVLYVACDGELVGRAQFRDQLRSDAREGLASLRRLGVREVSILTGDRADVAETVRGQVGADRVYAELLPEAKLRIVHKAIESGRRVAVVGDGVNDAPALAAAQVGIAMGASGTPVALETADVALMEDRIDRVGLLVGLARATRQVIVQNLWFAATFNIAALVASGAGLLGPALAALLHNVSSIAVVVNSARLVRYGRK